MKKFVAMVLSLLLALTLLAGCANTANPSSDAPSDPGSTPSGNSESGDKPVLKIGLLQFVEHLSLDTIRESIVARLEEELGDEYTLEIDYKNGSGDQSNLTSIAQTFAGDQKDVIIAIATPAAQAVAGVTQDIPLIFSAVTDPVGAKLVSDLNAPSGNATGTSDLIPVDQIFALASQLTPDAKKVGFIYNLGEDNSVSVVNDAKAYCDQNNLEYMESTITNVSELQQVVQSLVGKVDMFFTPIDNSVASAMTTYANEALKAKIPLYVGADSMVIEGGLATVGVDYVQLGRQTADMVVKVVKGTPISEIPVETLSNFSTYINKTTAAQLEISLDNAPADATYFE